jgi:hypothetical protein
MPMHVCDCRAGLDRVARIARPESCAAQARYWIAWAAIGLQTTLTAITSRATGHCIHQRGRVFHRVVRSRAGGSRPLVLQLQG